jgi:hypothetical protein
MSASEACLSAEERAHLVRLLRDSHTEFLELTGSLTEAEWVAIPPGGWSVQQTAEHIVTGEALMLRRAKAALAAEPDPEWAAQDARKTKFLHRVLPDRSQKATAPDPLKPTHNWSLAETTARFEQGRQRTLELLAALEGPVKNRLAAHPFPVFDKLNVHHWLLYIPLHNQRHNRQIAETLKAFTECGRS